MSNSRRARIAAPFAVAVVVAGMTCSSPTAPRFIHVELSSMSIDESALKSLGLLSVTGAPADTSFRLLPTQRLRAAISTSAGDAEELEFAPELCDGDHLCHSLGVMMTEGHHVRELEPVFASLPARLALGVVMAESGDTVHVVDWFATIWVYDPADVPSVIRTVSAQTGVKNVERIVVGWIRAPIRWRVLALRPAERSAVVPGDGVVQFQTGDMITVRYTQPGGSALTTSAVAP